jgi:hypothetical protein
MILTYSVHIVVALEKEMAMIFGMQKGGPPAEFTQRAEKRELSGIVNRPGKT